MGLPTTCLQLIPDVSLVVRNVALKFSVAVEFWAHISQTQASYNVLHYCNSELCHSCSVQVMEHWDFAGSGLLSYNQFERSLYDSEDFAR